MVKLTDIADAKTSLNTSIATKAPTNHASTATTYGLGTAANYGHVKTINALTQSSHVDGTALSAYQGYLLNQNKAPLASPALTGTPTTPTAALGTSTTQIANGVFVKNTVDTAIINAQPQKFTVKITTSGWSAVTDNGQTVYRKSVGIGASEEYLPILGLPPGQQKQLTSSLSLVNVSGTIYLYSAQIPNISLDITVTLVGTR